MIKKIINILSRIVAGVFLLLFICYLALMTPYVQTRIVGYITNQIEQKTGTTITIGRVSFHPIELLVLDDVYVEDYRKDTLMFCNRMSLKIDSLSFIKREFTITEMRFDQALFNLYITRTEEEGGITNIEVLMDNFERQQDSVPSTPSAINWKVNLDRIYIDNSIFRYIEDEYEHVDYGINWTDVECQNLNLVVGNINLTGGEYGADVLSLSFKEKTGFEVLNMSGSFVATDNNLLVTNTVINTERSIVNLDTLEYNWVPDEDYWRNFITMMQQRYVISESIVHFDDIAYFNGNLLGMDNTFLASGVVFNTINNLEGRDINIKLGEKTVMTGEFSSQGLPRFFDTDFNIKFNNATVSSSEISRIYMPWLESKYLNLPEFLDRFDYLFQGEFNGKIEDFNIKARSLTRGLQGDIALTYQPAVNAGFRYDGNFNLFYVDYNYLSGYSFLKNGSLAGRFSGVVSDEKNQFSYSGNIPFLNVYDSQINDIKLSLTMDDNDFYFISSVTNDSLKGNLVADYKLSEDLSVLNAKGEINVRSWDKIAGPIFGENESMSVAFDGRMLEHDENNFINVYIPRLSYGNSFGNYISDSIYLRGAKVIEDYFLRVMSNNIDLNLEGKLDGVKFADLKDAFIYQNFPDYKHAVKTTLPEKASFIISADLKRVNPLLKVIYPTLKITDNSEFSGVFSHLENILNFAFRADTLVYGDLSLTKPSLDLWREEENVKGIIRAHELSYMNFTRLYNVKDEINIIQNNLTNSITWANWGEDTYAGSFSANVRLLNYNGRYMAQMLINPSTFIMADSVWTVERSMIIKEDKNIYVNNFQISRGHQAFQLKGRIGENQRDSLAVVFNNFSLQEFNKILFENKFNLHGIVNGELVLKDFYDARLIHSDIRVDDWGINNDSLGILKFNSYWDVANKALNIHMINEYYEKFPLIVDGVYKPSVDSIDIDLELNEIGIHYLTAYFPDKFKDGTGTLSGNLEYSRSGGQSNIDGYLKLDSASVNFIGVNTPFHINDTLYVKNSRISFDEFSIYDGEGHAARSSGYFDLNTQKYDISLQFNNFKVLNTTQSPDDVFYGRLYISGLARSNNLAGNSSLLINLRPESKSVLYLPLYSVLADDNRGFLHFINGNQRFHHTNSNGSEQPSFMSGLELNANIELNNNLEVQIIFDPTIGDILKTVGRGDIKFVLDKNNQLTLFGEYEIERGDYLFTLSNLVNKKFILNPGGTIKWNGSPYDANMDVSATYNIRTSLYDLLSTSTTSIDRNSKVPVECILTLSENLTNPSVQFSINFPSLDVQSRSILQSMFSSQDEVNKQMFSLLLLNKFYTPEYMDKDPEIEERNAGYQMGVTTASELLSNQVSRWLSEISNNFDIGFSYRPGDQMSSNEFELALSTRLFNNRVSISANGNMIENPHGNTSATTAITGDFDVDVRINRKGTLKLKAYSHTDEKITYNAMETVQGVGISYQESFDTFRELINKYLGIFKRKKKIKSE